MVTKAMMPLSAPSYCTCFGHATRHRMLGYCPRCWMLVLWRSVAIHAARRHQVDGQLMTDQNQCRDPGADYVCEACVYVRSRSSPVPGRLPGPCSACKGVKPESCKSAKVRAQFSWRKLPKLHAMFDRDAPTPYISASKGEKSTILAWLRGKRLACGPRQSQTAVKTGSSIRAVNAPGSRGRSCLTTRASCYPDKHGWRLVDDMIIFRPLVQRKKKSREGNTTPVRGHVVERRSSYLSVTGLRIGADLFYARDMVCAAG